MKVASSSKDLLPAFKQERRAAILRAAAEIFFAVGYEAASMATICERVGGSKQTVYNYFRNKQELFITLIEELSAEVLEPLAPARLAMDDPASTLAEVGRRYLQIIMSATALNLYRAVVADSRRFPEIARIFFEHGPGRATAHLAEALTFYRDEGRILVADPVLAAEQFVGMVRDDRHLNVILGLRPPMDENEIDASVAQAVATFMDGVRPSQARSRQTVSPRPKTGGRSTKS
ncbi:MULTISPECIES: TetR/AcrR family transcriptional regulator [Rhodopseudomonas]|uniref:TetR/AcrR family transcriptional regulator n=1 Tax=Rhodopseudomonas TaxID=1073 RepID=UPI0005C859C4|nr:MULTISPECIES: TetR/AcrR family transcriptional regulator [Rhodopseudomonas]MDF3814339.1 TetR/AcrR family transcriptional regulator [Rhodopseudomonas sp. BAL398]WOK18035.1 TetR/AcrR family transcriptional regulator [Rhodopseudomonas sp. BAL398]